MTSSIPMALAFISMPYLSRCLTSSNSSGLTFLTVCWISQIQHMCTVTRDVQKHSASPSSKHIGGVHVPALFEVSCCCVSCFG